MKFNFTPLLLFVLLLSCSKNTEIGKIDLSAEQPFHSTIFTDNLEKYPSAPSLDDQEFEHYLVLYRFKKFDHPDDAFIKIVYGASTESNLNLSLGETALSGDNHIVAYTFSNEWYPFLLDDIEADRLEPVVFDEIPFTYTVNEETTYEGAFPDPGFLKNNETVPYIEQISKSTMEAISWAPSKYPNGKIKIVILHTATISSPTLNPIKEILVDDTGSYFFTSEDLAEYNEGDEVSINLVRDIFIKQGDILVRGIEEQYWDRIKIIN